MMRLQVMLAAMIIALAVNLPGSASARVFHDKADLSLLILAESALVAPERTSWTRPQSADCDGDPVDEAEASSLPPCGDIAILSWQPKSVARPYHAPVVSPPARGPPTPAA